MSKRQLTLSALIASTVLVLLATAGCSITRSQQGTGSPSATPVPSPPLESPPLPPASPSTSARPTSLSLYFLRGAYVGTARRTVLASDATAQIALEALLAGPTVAEREAGLHTQIPEGTHLLGLTIKDGLAVADLSAAFGAGVDPREDKGRLAEVVYTLTQFPTVDGVRLKVEGDNLVFRSPEGTVQTRPLTRRTFEDVTPAIFVERPAVGDVVSSPMVVSGTANTFEAQFMIRVRDDKGVELYNESARATSGTGTRGLFSERVTFATNAPAITLEVYETSMASGLPTNVVKIPLRLAGAAGATPSAAP